MVAVSYWVKIASIATAVGGLGAMVSAIYSFRSAHSSERAARDAKDALAESLRPDVHLRFTQAEDEVGTPGMLVVRAVVLGPLSPAGPAAVLPAADVRIDFNLASGEQGSGFTSFLGPGVSAYAERPPYLSVNVREQSDDWPSTERGDLLSATVTFSDTRRVATYQRSGSVELWRSKEPRVHFVARNESRRGHAGRLVAARHLPAESGVAGTAN
jgi:hypothetical protein